MKSRLTLIITSVFLFGALVVPGGDAQSSGESQTACELEGVHCCGELELTFLNPDLKPQSDGKIHASGQFFAQFQAIGADADQIETFAFSFGADPQFEFDESFCDHPVRFTGQQLMFYRADTDPTDGFFINLQTELVPDGEYTAAVHAYDANDEELARFWARAVVKNCDDAVVNRCASDASQVNRHDTTVPWPIILPGDGQLADGETGFTIEFAEAILEDRLKVTLNGEDITDQLEGWDGRLWDNNYLPGYLPHGLDDQRPDDCADNQVQNCKHLGPAYRWTERELTDADVIRVEAYDDALEPNLAKKDIHIGSSVAGGAISELVPILTWSADEVTGEAAAPGSAVFRFTLTNSGAAEGHPFASGSGPADWTHEWNPNHLAVPPGGQTTQELTVNIPAGTPGGEYRFNATMEYQQGSQLKTLEQVLLIDVLGDAAELDELALQETEDADDADEESPGVGILAVLAAVASALVLRRRN